MLALVDSPQTRLAGARRAMEWIAARVEKLQAEAQKLLGQATARREAQETQVLATVSDRKSRKLDLTNDCDVYVQSLVRELTLVSILKTVHGIRARVTSCTDQLRDLWRETNQLAEEFTSISASPSGYADSDAKRKDEMGLATDLAAVVSENMPEMVERLDREMQKMFFGSEERLRHILADSRNRRADLIDHMRAAARRIILRCVNDLTLATLQRTRDDRNRSQLSGLLQRGAQSATPQLAKVGGGGQRLLLTVPEPLDPAELAEMTERATGNAITVIRGESSEIRFCCETEGLSFDGLKSILLRRRPDCEELAHRLHTRIDVDW
jgi:hypothetical protein